MLFTHLSEIIQFVLGVGYILGHVNVKKVSVALQISGPGREGHTLLECCLSSPLTEIMGALSDVFR